MKIFLWKFAIFLYFKYEMLQNNGQTFDGRRYVWGPGLYIGWAAFVSNVLASFTLCCSICGGEFEEDNQGFMDRVVNDIGDHIRYRMFENMI